MSDNKQLIASVFSSAIKTSLSEQKAAPPKKKKATVKKQSVETQKPDTTGATKNSVVPTPADEGWVAVKNSKKKTTTAGAPVVAPSHAVILGSTADQKDALTTNAFYLPRRLEKHLHKNPSSKKNAVNKPSLVVSQAPPPLTKSQRKNQLRAQKRAKKRAEKEQAALLLKKAQALAPAVKQTMNPAEETEDIQSQSSQTIVTVATSTSEEEAKRPSNGDCPLLSLPYDVLLNGVMSFLRPEEMCQLGACSTYAKEVSEAGFLWQNLFKQRFAGSQLSPTNMQEWKLAYQLSLTKVVDRLRCGTTHKTFMEDVVGVGVDFTANPKTGSVDYIELSQDLLSETAFFKNKVRKDVFGNNFTLFLPLYFSADHFKRALPQIQKTIAHLARNRKETFQRFHPFMVLDVLPKIVTTFVVLLSDNGISACRKSYQGLIRIHRLFLALAHQYPEIQTEALRRLRLFVSNEKHRTKANLPNLGAILPLLMILDEKVCGWPQLRLPYLSESFDRMVLWACKKHPQLERTHDKVTGEVESASDAEKRVALTLEAGQVTLRLKMFHIYFCKALNRGSTQERANRYDRFFGQPEPKEMESVKEDVEDSWEDEEEEEVANKAKAKPKSKPNQASETPSGDSTIQFAHFREQINYIMTPLTWQKFMAFVGLPCPSSKAEMARRLRCHVANSRRKKYHTAGMDFSRIQASGTSRILSKGQEYSASSDLRRVVFRDDWGFDGHTKYLDATCLLYKGKKLMETVDFQNTEGSNGAVDHSGDVMTENTGSHTIDLDLDALDNEVTSCVFVLSAYAEATLADIKSPKVSFSNAETEEVLCTYNLDSQDKVDYLTSVIMCRLYRVSSGTKQGWHVQAIGDAHKGAADNYGPIYEAVKKLL